MTPFRCPKCGRVVEVCTAKAKVAHVCPKAGVRPAMVQSQAEVRA